MLRRRRFRRQFDRSAINEVIVNRRYRFLYCPIPKVGSTTFKILLHQLAGVPVEEVAGPDLSRLGALHDARENRLSYLFELDDDEVASLLADPAWFKFVFVRNPWTRTLSAYRNKIEAHAVKLLQPEYRHNPDRLWVGAIVEAISGTPDGPVTFKEFARLVASMNVADMNLHFRPQSTVGGFDIVDYDFVGKLENIDEDYGRVAARLGIDLPFPSNRRPFSGATSHLAAYYDDETVALVGSTFAEDAARFGYSYPG